MIGLNNQLVPALKIISLAFDLGAVPFEIPGADHARHIALGGWLFIEDGVCSGASLQELCTRADVRIRELLREGRFQDASALVYAIARIASPLVALERLA